MNISETLKRALGLPKPKEDLTSAVGVYRDIVRIGMKRVREGKVSSDNIQTVYLQTSASFLKVMDVNVHKGLTGVSSIGSLADGLYITFTHLRDGIDHSLLLPRSDKEIGNRHLRQFGAERESLENLLGSLTKGMPISEITYKDSVRLAKSLGQKAPEVGSH